MADDQSTPQSGFRTTRWTMVIRAGEAPGDQGPARVALEELCAAYWYPLYALGRRRGLSKEAAEDGVQGFFADLLEREDLAKADPERGRFRAFLRTAFRNFLSSDRRRAEAEKRGGGRQALSLDVAMAEERYSAASGKALDPKALFDRAWALALIEGVLDELQASYEQRGRGPWFEALRGGLLGEAGLRDYAAVAAALGSTEGAVKVAAHRLRERFREALLCAVADTLDEPEAEGQAEEARRKELAALFAALGNG